MSSQTYQINELFGGLQTPLGKLITQARAIHKLNELFLEILDPKLIPHCQVGHYQSGVLTLFAENASCATTLRYSVPTLLSKLRSVPDWAGLCSIQVKVQRNWHQMQPPQEVPIPKPSSMSSEQAEQLLHLAADLKGKPGMEALVRSLERLATHKAEPKT